jgi:hypothetical protein
VLIATKRSEHAIPEQEHPSHDATVALINRNAFMPMEKQPPSLGFSF